MKVVSVLMIRWPLFAAVPALAAIAFWLLGPLGCNAVLPRLRRPRTDCRPELPLALPAPAAALIPPPPAVPPLRPKAAFRANSAAHRLSSAPRVSRRSHAVH
jgi:hypothetical protein